MTVSPFNGVPMSKQPDRIARVTIRDQETGEVESHPTKHRATWRDWLPEGMPEPTGAGLISRHELIADLADRGAGLTARGLQYWENQGVTPRPVIQSHRGAVRAVYPREWLDLLEWAHHESEKGTRLDLIGMLVRFRLSNGSAWGIDIERGMQPTIHKAQKAVAGIAEAFRSEGWQGMDRISGARIVLLDDDANELYETEFKV